MPKYINILLSNYAKNHNEPEDENDPETFEEEDEPDPKRGKWSLEKLK